MLNIYKITAYMGIIVILMSFCLFSIFPSRPANLDKKGMFTPIIIFEFAQTFEDINMLFGTEDSLERRNFIRSMDLGNWLDFIYMIMYSCFLACFCYACIENTGLKLFKICLAITPIIFLGDLFENIQLLGITQKISTKDFASELIYLQVFTWIKWGGLCIFSLLLSLYFIKGSLFSKIIGINGITCFILGICSFFYPSVINEIFTISIAFLFMLLIIYCFFINKIAPNRLY